MTYGRTITDLPDDIDPVVLINQILDTIKTVNDNTPRFPEWICIAAEAYYRLPFRCKVAYQDYTKDGSKVVMVSTEEMIFEIEKYCEGREDPK